MSTKESDLEDDEQTESEAERVDLWRNSAGYGVLTGSYDDEFVHTHQLDAIASGACPHRVFDPTVHVHHRIDGASIKLDLPGNVVPLDRVEHARKHARDAHETPHISAILSSCGGDEDA